MKIQKLINAKAGDLAVMNGLPDAAVFEVVAIDGFQATVIDFSLKGQNPANQYTDTSLLYKPSKAQLNAAGIAA